LRERGIDELVLAGMMSQMCIDATTRAAFDLGYRCRVAHDACAAVPISFAGVSVPVEQVHAAFMAALAAVYARVEGVLMSCSPPWPDPLPRWVESAVTDPSGFAQATGDNGPAVDGGGVQKRDAKALVG